MAKSGNVLRRCDIRAEGLSTEGTGPSTAPQADRAASLKAQMTASTGACGVEQSEGGREHLRNGGLEGGGGTGGLRGHSKRLGLYSECGREPWEILTVAKPHLTFILKGSHKVGSSQ